MKRFLFVLAFGILGVVVGIYLISQNKSSTQTAPADQTTPQGIQTQDYSFTNPKKSAHWETNTPEHGSILAGVPVNAVINFNFDLVSNSTISIKMGGKDYGVGQVIVDQNKLSMRRNMDPVAPDGVYTVEYLACWPDKTCHDGSFQFAIDRSKSSEFIDMRGQSIVNVGLTQIAFNPQNIRISRGTKVIWTNNDTVFHYVNTDPHAGHNYFPEQNSKVLDKEDIYSLTFDSPGVYPYHCSAHAASMIGAILVE